MMGYQLVERTDLDGSEYLVRFFPDVGGYEEASEADYAAFYGPDDSTAVDPARPRSATPLVDTLERATLTIADLAALPPAEWFLEGTVALDSLAMPYGASGSGKTHVMLGVVFAATHGVDFCGLKVHTGPVVYVVSEGVRGLSKRVAAWAEYHGHPEQLHELHFVTAPVNITDGGWVDALAEYCVARRPVAVVFDTLARAMPGADENSSRDAGTAIAYVDQIRAATGTAVFLIHHTGKDTTKGARGSSALRAAVDTEIEVSSVDTRTTVKVTKQRDHEIGDPLELERISVGESCVLEVATYSTTITKGALAALETLRAIDVPGGVPATTWKVAAAEKGVAESSFFRHRAALLRARQVFNLGTDKSPRYSVYREGDER